VKPEISHYAEGAKEVALRLLKGRLLPVALAAAFVIANAGCAVADNPAQNPVFGDAPVAVSALPPEPTPTPSPTDKLKYEHVLPSDIVSDQELWEKYHTRIWNTDSVKLYLRKGALEKESILKKLHRAAAEGDDIRFIDSWIPETSSRTVRPVPLTTQLDVVLIPGNIVRSASMTAEQKQFLPELYRDIKASEARAWEIAKEYVTRVGPSDAKRFQEFIQQIEKDYAEGRIPREAYDIQRKHINEELDRLSEDLSKYDFDSFYDRFGGIPAYTHAAGQYMETGVAEVDEKGNTVRVRSRFYIAIAVPESGISASLDPKRSSFNDPDRFTLAPSANREYPLLVPSEARISQTIRHEFIHNEANHPITDYLTLTYYTEAYDRFMEGDDSLYYFVFETPRGNIVAEAEYSDSSVGVL
jgi:hypothetical protein